MEDNGFEFLLLFITQRYIDPNRAMMRPHFAAFAVGADQGRDIVAGACLRPCRGSGSAAWSKRNFVRVADPCRRRRRTRRRSRTSIGRTRESGRRATRRVGIQSSIPWHLVAAPGRKMTGRSMEFAAVASPTRYRFFGRPVRKPTHGKSAASFCFLAQQDSGRLAKLIASRGRMAINWMIDPDGVPMIVEILRHDPSATAERLVITARKLPLRDLGCSRSSARTSALCRMLSPGRLRSRDSPRSFHFQRM